MHSKNIRTTAGYHHGYHPSPCFLAWSLSDGCYSDIAAQVMASNAAMIAVVWSEPEVRAVPKDSSQESSSDPTAAQSHDFVVDYMLCTSTRLVRTERFTASVLEPSC